MRTLLAASALALWSTWAAANGSSASFNSGQYGCTHSTVSSPRSDARLETYGETTKGTWSNDQTIGFKLVVPLKKQDPSKGIAPYHCERLAEQAAQRQQIEIQREAIDLEIKKLELERMRALVQRDIQRGQASDEW